MFQNNWIPRHANSKPQFLRQSSLSINRSNFDVIDSPVKKSISNDESKLCSTLPRNFSYSQKQFGMTTKCPEVKDNSWFKTPPTILNRNMKIKPRWERIIDVWDSKTHIKIINSHSKLLHFVYFFNDNLWNKCCRENYIILNKWKHPNLFVIFPRINF